MLILIIESILLQKILAPGARIYKAITYNITKGITLITAFMSQFMKDALASIGSKLNIYVPIHMHNNETK